MWPIVLGQLNLPKQLRYQFANLLLVGIISSHKNGSEPKDLDPYLEVLVGELIYVLDCRGLGTLFSLTVTGSYRGCAWCLMKVQYCKCKHIVFALGS